MSVDKRSSDNMDHVAQRPLKKLKPNNDGSLSLYKTVKEGRIVGYPIIVTQSGGTEHDAILLGCKADENPEEHLATHRDGKVKIRWKYAGYNGNVSTNTVRLKLMNIVPPIRKAAVLSGLLKTGDNGANMSNGNTTSEILEDKDARDKDDDYKKNASVGYTGDNTWLNKSAGNANETATYVKVDDIAGGILHHKDTDKHVPKKGHEGELSVIAPLQLVASNYLGQAVKTEGVDTDDETDMLHNCVIKPEVPASMPIKTEESVYEYDTDNELDPLAGIGKMYADTQDKEMNGEQKLPAVLSTELDIYEYDTDTDESRVTTNSYQSGIRAEGEEKVKPLSIMSGKVVKYEEIDTDDEMDTMQQLASSNVESTYRGATSTINGRSTYDNAFDDDTEVDVSRPLAVSSDMNIETSSMQNLGYPNKEESKQKLETKLKCSICNIPKSHKNFSRYQLMPEKIARAKCRDCTEALHQSALQAKHQASAAKYEAKKLKRRRLIVQALEGSEVVVCSTCQIEKSINFFPASNLLRGTRKCHECISNGIRDEQHAIENKQMENLEERQCAGCTLTKKKEDFNTGQIRLGKKSMCKECIQARARARHKTKVLKEEDERKKGKILVCSTCKIEKGKSCFFSSQRKKRIHARCKQCISRGIRDEQHAIENKEMESLEERVCAECTLTKKKEDFYHYQTKLGKESICKECLEIVTVQNK